MKIALRKKTFSYWIALLLGLLQLAGACQSRDPNHKLDCPPGTRPHSEKQVTVVEHYCLDDDGLKQGPYQSRYIKGNRISKEGQMVAGKSEGPWKIYRSSGKLRMEQTMRAGQRVAEVRYFLNGYISEKLNIQDGKLHGPYTKQHENGTKRAQFSYLNGSMEGPHLQWYDNGKVHKQGAWKGGKPDGPWGVYHENGAKKYQGTYQNGGKEGLFTYWDEKGNKEQEITLASGKEHGPAVEYHPTGQVKARGNYEQGKKAADWKYFTLDGKAAPKPE